MKFDRTHSADEIASYINAKLIGDPNTSIVGINEMHKADPGDLTFVDYYKYYDEALNSSATAIIIDREFDCPDGKILLISEDPFRDYNILAKRFRPFRAADNLINQQTYYCSESASIGNDTTIMPGCFIGKDVKIGDGCIIYPNVVIKENTIIGDNVIVHANTTIGTDAFYYKLREHADGKRYDKMHTIGSVVIEDHVEIGSNCVVDKGISGITRIGCGTKINNQVMIGDGVIIGKNCLISAQCGIDGKSILGDNVVLWGQVGIAKSIIIGEGCVVLSKSGVNKHLEAGKIYIGTPAKEAKKKWTEIALMKKLPDMWEKLESL